MRHKRLKKRDGLQSKVGRLKPSQDNKGSYIPFCDYDCHRGLVLNTRVCETRNCNHYHKLYITEETKYVSSRSIESIGE